MAYYVLGSARGELYARRLTLTEDEARRYGREGEMVVVRAVCVWTDRAALENFRQFLSMTQDDRDSPFRELVDEMRGESVSVLEAGGPGTLRSLLRSHRAQEFVLINPGPAQEVRKVEQFLASLGSG